MLQADSLLGNYKILRPLGSGGMADVYEAEDQKLGRRVALKVLPPEFGRNPQLVARFEKEVRAAAALNHHGIVTVFEVGQDQGLHYFSMRLLTGGDLRARIDRGLTPLEALATLREVADAFGHAHTRGFVHRDVKPENIMFDEDGYPVLTDFGIAKALDAGTRMTATGVSIGTPRYISPEQARGRAVDARADLYSLGVILYEMLSGKPPYDGDEALAVIFKHVTEPIPKLPAEHDALQPLIEKLMAKEPDQRPASAKELIKLVDSFLPRTATREMPVASTQQNPLIQKFITPRTGTQTAIDKAAIDSGARAHAKQLAEEEQRQKEDARKRQEEAEAVRRKAEEDAARARAEEGRRAAEALRKKQEEEARAKAAEEERLRREEEARRKRDEEARQKAEAEAARQAAAEKKRLEQEARRKAEEEERRKREEEAARQAAAEKKRLEQEVRRKAEAEAERQRRKQEELERKAEERRRKETLEREKAEAAARLKAEHEQRKREAEAQKQAEKEERLRKEREARLQAASAAAPTARRGVPRAAMIGLWLLAAIAVAFVGYRQLTAPSSQPVSTPAPQIDEAAQKLKQQLEEEARSKAAAQAEQETQRKADEAAARLKAEQEAAARKAQEESDARKRTEQDAAARKAREDEALRLKMQEEEAQRQAAQEEERRRAEQDAAAKKAQEQDAARRKAEQEAARRKADDEARRRAEQQAAEQQRVREQEAAKAAQAASPPPQPSTDDQSSQAQKDDEGRKKKERAKRPSGF